MAAGTTPAGTGPTSRNGETLLEVEGVVKHFRASSGGRMSGKSGDVRALDGVSFRVEAGETLGIVGESGCGKSTLARCIMRLLDVDAGRISFRSEEITHLSPAEMRPRRRAMAMIFQDPFASLNPRMRIGSVVAEPIEVHEQTGGRELRDRVCELLELVGLSASDFNRYPHEFSGGQRQRIGIARALALSPSLVVCDEPVSALDVSVQAQVLNLLAQLQRELSLTYVFIGHNLDVVRHVCDRICVMYLGRIVEMTTKDRFYQHPRHPYSAALLSAAPVADPMVAKERSPIVLPGEVPSPIDPPPGCHFHPRCPRRGPGCDELRPPLAEITAGHNAACYYPVDQWPLRSPEQLARTEPAEDLEPA